MPQVWSSKTGSHLERAGEKVNLVAIGNAWYCGSRSALSLQLVSAYARAHAARPNAILHGQVARTSVKVEVSSLQWNGGAEASWAVPALPVRVRVR
jgi:hypothetical protein